MSEKMKIKVIKKGSAAASGGSPVKERVRKRDAAREMVSTVSSWVSDLQQKKKESTRLAIEQLFGQQVRPNES
jgi:hypothetical protein